MPSKTQYTVDDSEKWFSIEGSPELRYGRDELLSSESTDITFHQPWYPLGYTEVNFLSREEFSTLRNGLTECIKRIVEEECKIRTNEFSLTRYHEVIVNDADHLRIVRRTRDLFPNDFGFRINDLIPRFENILGFKLTDFNPLDQKQVHIIVRINRPLSNDYNPPHKDIYEGYDNKSYIPRFVNFWIPIAGVNEKSNLPLVPRSHLINESQILRTFEGGIIQGNKYRVRMIKSWSGNRSLERSTVSYGQVLIFSSHLIRGLACNENTDKTRVALEFRLFKS